MLTPHQVHFDLKILIFFISLFHFEPLIQAEYSHHLSEVLQLDVYCFSNNISSFRSYFIHSNFVFKSNYTSISSRFDVKRIFNSSSSQRCSCNIRSILLLMQVNILCSPLTLTANHLHFIAFLFSILLLQQLFQPELQVKQHCLSNISS